MLGSFADDTKLWQIVHMHNQYQEDIVNIVNGLITAIWRQMEGNSCTCQWARKEPQPPPQPLVSMSMSSTVVANFISAQFNQSSHEDR